jgi:hypothetical protein
MSRLGEEDYKLIFNNCQHFARWCATGDHESEQVRSVAATTGTVITPTGRHGPYLDRDRPGRHGRRA